MEARSSIRAQSRPSGWTAALVAVAALIALAGVSAAPLAEPVAHAQSTGYKQISAGWWHTCAVRLDGGVDCWGSDGYGEATSLGGVFVQVSAGGSHTCGLRPDGHVQCWGKNDLGIECNEAGDRCWYVYGGQIDAPQDVLFKQVSAGDDHTCGLTLEDTINCWGDNRVGQAPDPTGSFIQVSAGEQHTCAVRSDGYVKCWGDDTKGRATSIAGPFIYVSAGGSHNCAIRQSDRTVYCWGANGYGQSSPPYGVFTEVSAGHLHTCGLRGDRSLECWGYNFYGQVGKAPDGWFKQVDSGEGHACAISDADAAFCWGKNNVGQAKVPTLSGPPSVTYAFAGFCPPVEPEPALNEVKAGSAIPLKFSLGGDEGLEVIAPDSPASQPVNCTSFNAEGTLETAQPAGGSALSYDPVSDQYTYVWKTEKAWAGTCRVLALKLADETEHLVAFKFK